MNQYVLTLCRRALDGCPVDHPAFAPLSEAVAAAADACEADARPAREADEAQAEDRPKRRQSRHGEAVDKP